MVVFFKELKVGFRGLLGEGYGIYFGFTN